MHIHFIAIGGTGMGALAGYLKAQGHEITGSDGPLYPPMSDYLRQWGLQPVEGYRAENLIPRPDLVIIGNAVGAANPEAQAALASGVPCLSMPQAIRRFGIEGRESLVITGTHGKTTTSALTAFLLDHAGLRPDAVIGGVMKHNGRSFFAGGGGQFVIEGDEYETSFFDKGPKFFHYAPHQLVIGNLEFDHLDNFKSLDELEAAFAKLAAMVPADGAIFLGGESPAARRAVAAAAPKCQVVSFGLAEDCQVHPGEIEYAQDGTRFDLLFEGGSLGRFHSRLMGEHNLRNAMAAILVARRCGIPFDKIAAGLAAFEGVKRRQEYCGMAGGAKVFDDFGHHPTAVAQTLDAFRLHGFERLWAVLEPKSYTASTNRFQSEFAEALAGRCERLFALEVWWKSKVPDAERFSARKLAADLAPAGITAAACANPDELEKSLREALNAAAKDAASPTLIFFSSGTHGGVRARLLNPATKIN
jgi:UDP-N-acetylmuramate: L-alanyl-gamma-D-glutamyl-meso-diaminopimelate ligase